MFGLIVFGAISWKRLGVSQMPDVDFPVLTIAATWEGAAPEIMESEIVDRLEQAIISVEGIRDMGSSIRQGQANITLEFELNRNIDTTLQEVQSAISRVRLPLNVDPPTITKTNPDDQPIIWLGIASKGRSLHDLIVYIDRQLKDQFQILPGVGEVILGGWSDRNLRVWLDDKKLKEYELTALDVQKALELGHVEIAAGTIENDQKEFNVRTMGEGLTPEEVGNILITQRGSKPIYTTNIHIKDVARVEDGLNDIRRISRISGVSGVGLGIKKQRGTNAVEVADAIKAYVKELSKTLPPDISIQVNFDSTIFIKESIQETQFTLILSAIITGLVCWLFLGSWNSTFNVLLSIPTSIIGSFLILYFLGFTLNMFTLLGLALAVGIVVDDAIMVLENIVRHAQMGKDRVEASRVGAREITFAAIAASVAVIAIFLPVAFMKGIIGKFFFQFGMTISGAVALSLLEAITLTPMRCSQLLESHEHPNAFAQFSKHQFERLSETYRKVLVFCLNWRWSVILISMGLFLASLFLVKFVRKEFIPAQDQSMFLIRFETPVGSSLQFTSDIVRKVEKFLQTQSEVARYFAAIGGFGGGEVNSGMIFVSMKPRSERKLKQDKFMALCREGLSKIPSLHVTLQDLSTRGFTAQRGYPVEFNIRGSDWDVLREKAQEITQKLKDTTLVTDIDTDYRVGMPEVKILPERQRAAEYGVTMEAIGNTITAAIGGVRQGKFTSDIRRYDVRLRLEANERTDPEVIKTLDVRNTYGELVPIGNVVQTKVVPTLQTITRRGRERSISIYANVAPGKSQSDALAAAEDISKKALPEGYRFFFGGGAQTFHEAFDSLFLALWLGILVAYMVLASQFNSFLHPITVLLALPFSLSGAFFALYLGQQSLNLYSMIGIILLMGIVKKNSILLVEFINRKRYEENLPLREAILAASPIRLRPILMTSFATLAAALPPALALGPGAESRIPMSITVIGGVLVSTFFTLLVVPCAYSLMAKLEHTKSSTNIPI